MQPTHLKHGERRQPVWEQQQDTRDSTGMWVTESRAHPTVQKSK